ncbi:MAG: hypothetical protein JXQ87_00360 [Bacteroidia bacterium]
MGAIEKIGNYLSFRVEKAQFEIIAKEAFRYAIISSPFTINRMGIDDLDKRILNITKGKLAEKMLEAFFKSLRVKVDFESCQTPFHKIDRRDFLWRDFEWDLKNNFITHSELHLNSKTIGQLPCLIPNRKKGDQWDKRNQLYFKTPKGAAFLFSFMIGRLINGPLESDIINVKLNKDQKIWLHKLNEQYGGKSFKQSPFLENDFWKTWSELDIPELHNSFEVGFNSPLYLTAIANAADWSSFKPRKPQTFANGLFRTRIDNMCVEVSKLRSLSMIIPS